MARPMTWDCPRCGPVRYEREAHERWHEMADAAPARPPEPKGRGVRVRDRDGHVWRRGTTRWTCEAPVGTPGVGAVGRMHWASLVDEYGPLTVVAPRHAPG